MRYSRMASSKPKATAFSVPTVSAALSTSTRPPKKRPFPRGSATIAALSEPVRMIKQADAPILWVAKGDVSEVSKRVKQNISTDWKVRAVCNTPRPGSLTSQAAVSSWIQPEIQPTDSLEEVIRR